MVSVCFYFQVHQPHRLNKYSVFDIGKNKNYFDTEKNKHYIKKVSKKCYLPTNKLLLDLIEKTDGKFKCAFSITGTVLEQLEEHEPKVIQSFKELVKTGNVEILSETYYHSFAWLYSKEEFRKQINLHKKKIKKLFNFKPKVFRNTELMFNNEMANFIQKLGYKGILAEGVDRVLGWRSPNFVYSPKTAENLGLLLKNYKMSDDIAFRFSNSDWSHWPLTAEKYSDWINKINGCGDVLNLFMDYETFGEHQWEETGIFDFLKALPSKILKHPDNNFVTPLEAIEKYPKRDVMDIHDMTSWADIERDLSAWMGNEMQRSALNHVYELEEKIKKEKNQKLLDEWRKLQISDHFYYMCTKWFSDGDVHKYFNPYDSPYDAFIAFMNVLNDVKLKLNKRGEKNAKKRYKSLKK